MLSSWAEALTMWKSTATLLDLQQPQQTGAGLGYGCNEGDHQRSKDVAMHGESLKPLAEPQHHKLGARNRMGTVSMSTASGDMVVVGSYPRLAVKFDDGGICGGCRESEVHTGIIFGKSSSVQETSKKAAKSLVQAVDDSGKALEAMETKLLSMITAFNSMKKTGNDLVAKLELMEGDDLRSEYETNRDKCQYEMQDTMQEYGAETTDKKYTSLLSTLSSILPVGKGKAQKVALKSISKKMKSLADRFETLKSKISKNDEDLMMKTREARRKRAAANVESNPKLVKEEMK